MHEHRDEPPATILIGPGIEPRPAPETRYRDEAAARREGRRLLLRLVIAFVLVVAIAVVCFVLLPAAGVYLPVWVPLASFAAIAVAALLNAGAEGTLPGATDENASDPDGRPVGCCPGPRPPRFLREPRDRR